MVKKECAYDWPIEITDTVIIRRAGLQGRTKKAMKDVYEEFKVGLSSSLFFNVKVFYHQEKKRFYWWDMYKDSRLAKSGFEFFPRHGQPASYIIFTTEPTQSPLLCTASFKHIRLY